MGTAKTKHVPSQSSHDTSCITRPVQHDAAGSWCQNAVLHGHICIILDIQWQAKISGYCCHQTGHFFIMSKHMYLSVSMLGSPFVREIKVNANQWCDSLKEKLKGSNLLMQLLTKNKADKLIAIIWKSMLPPDWNPMMESTISYCDRNKMSVCFRICGVCD